MQTIANLHGGDANGFSVTQIPPQVAQSLAHHATLGIVVAKWLACVKITNLPPAFFSSLCATSLFAPNSTDDSAQRSEPIR